MAPDPIKLGRILALLEDRLITNGKDLDDVNANVLEASGDRGRQNYWHAQANYLHGQRTMIRHVIHDLKAAGVEPWPEKEQQ